MATDGRALLMLLTVVITWGLTWPVNKVLVASVPPLWTVALRSAIATAVLFAIALGRRRLAWPPREDVPVLPHTPRAARVLVGALYVSLELGHNYIGTEHLLLALFREPEGRAATYLAAQGATEEALRSRLVAMIHEIAQQKAP